jgi:uncharacterized delta-60 repeat protein
MKMKLLIILIVVFWSVPLFAQSVDTAWVRRYDALGSTHDLGYAIAVDESGNVYVTGYSVSGALSSDYLTIKHHPNGDTAWVRTYDGPGNSYDMAFAIAVDGLGNVYVTGGSYGLGKDFDFATVKYYANGGTAWVRRYSGPGSSQDFALDLAVDDSGNVYVTGESSGSGTDQDYLTIKYYSNGDTAWVRRYDGPASSSDGAGAIAVDDSGNVYVTGASYGFGINLDYLTIKYYSNGDTAWVRRYDGPASSSDRAGAIAVDDSGNVYVTGDSYDPGTYTDYATMKYYPDGDTAWVRRYEGPGNSYDYASAIAVDGLGNVFVTGYSGGSGASAWAKRHDGPVNFWDYARGLRIDESGNVDLPGESGGSGASAWAKRHHGPGNPWDYARGPRIDESDNIYVPGESYDPGTNDDYATIKYYPNGDTAWVRTYDGPGNAEDQAFALGVDGSGNVYVTGQSYDPGTYEDYATIKYYPDGDTAWVRRYDGPGNAEDQAFALGVDGSGGIYVTGGSLGSGTGFDCATVKYFSNGDTAWITRCDGSGSCMDASQAIAVDGLGNVYVTGWSWDAADYDYLTIKHYSNGDTAWVRRYDGPGSFHDQALAIAVDGPGNVYVTGGSHGLGTDYDFLTIKYYSYGDTAWVRRYNGPGDSADYGISIAVDESGNIYVTGGSYGTGTDEDYLTIKYYANGDTAWVRRYNGPADSSDMALAIAVDDSGNVYVTGESYDPGTNDDYATIKYYPNGDTAWVRRYNDPRNTWDEARALAVDGSGNVYVTGESYDPGTTDDYATIKYYPNGDTAWVRRYDGPGNSWDDAWDLAVDGWGNVYVTGSSGLEEYQDYATLKYCSDGENAWVARYNGPADSTDLALAMELDDSGNVYVTGVSMGRGTGFDCATIKYYNPPPDPFSLLFPPRKAFTPRVVRFDWEDAVDPCDRVRYDLYVSSSYQFPPGETSIDSDLLISEHIKTLDFGTYYWKVKAKDNWGAERWSNQTRCFKVTGIHAGDFNKDGSIDVADVVFLINYLYTSGPPPDPLELGDVNCDDGVNIGDVIFLINYLFQNGPPPSC